MSLGRGLVKIVATCSLVKMYSILTLCSTTCSLRKWYLMGISFVFEFITRFFEMLIALVLSHMIDIS
jgi:hypothetical protein